MTPPKDFFKGKSKTQIKAYKGFDYACRQASICRHEKYMASCEGCPELKTCDIQARIEKNRAIM
jgi:hypothetical protein